MAEAVIPIAHPSIDGSHKIVPVSPRTITRRISGIELIISVFIRGTFILSKNLGHLYTREQQKRNGKIELEDGFRAIKNKIIVFVEIVTMITGEIIVM